MTRMDELEAGIRAGIAKIEAIREPDGGNAAYLLGQYDALTTVLALITGDNDEHYAHWRRSSAIRSTEMNFQASQAADAAFHGPAKT